MSKRATIRNHELSLMILGLILGAGAVALVAVAEDTDRLAKAAPYMIVPTIAYIGMHIAMRRWAREADPLLLPIVAVLNMIGLAAIYRLSPEEFGPAQLTWIGVGVVVFIVALVGIPDHLVLARFKYILGFIGVGLLLLPLTPVGTTINGARLWIRLGALSFQPGELAKICLVVFFAAYLAERKELLAEAPRRSLGLHIPNVRHFGPLLVMWGLSLAVMFYEKDLGSSLLFFSIFLLMIYVATARLAYVTLGMTMFAAGAFVGYQSFAHVQSRVRVWLDVFDPDLLPSQSFQLAQSLFAMATGGLFGTGLNQGRPDLIPAAETDFIFSTVGEELGLMGTAAILLCFLLLVSRGLRIALNATTDFGQLLAAGLTVILGVQTIVILGGVTRLLPLTGITLPFMSYGGSSLISNFLIVALLVRISHATATRPDPAATAEIMVVDG